MIKIDYRFKALQPIHTGSDVNLGTLRQLRREKVFINRPKSIRSRFRPDQKRLKRQALALLLLRLWDKLPNRNRTTIYEEIASKLLSSTAVRSKEEFLQALCHKLEIREVSTSRDRRFDVVDILELFDDYELLDLIRNESQYIVTFFRKLKDDNIFWIKETGKAKVAKKTIFEEVSEVKSPEVLIMDALEEVINQPFEEITIPSHIDHVPFISGNSFRGLLRRVSMYDFCKLAGIKDLSPQRYHQLFTGGTLTDTNGFEDLAYRDLHVHSCPMLGLFGSAVGKQTITGELRVSKGELICAEHGTGPTSYHDLIDIDFGTRHDTSKSESIVNIEGNDDTTHQMLYQTEVFVTGAEFSHGFYCMSDEELIQSAFWRMLKLFVREPFITAKGAVGYGEIDLSHLLALIPEDGDQLYLKYIADNKDDIRKIWSVKQVELVAI